MGKKLFKIFSILFILSCVGFYGYRLVHYYKIYSTNSDWEEAELTPLYKKIINNSYTNNDLSKLDNEYVYNYKNNNNYVKYSGILWRIEKISEDGKIRLISTENASVLTNSSPFEESFISKYLNDEKNSIYRNLENPDSYLEKTEVCLDNIIDMENITCENVKEYLIGIPSIKDYQLSGGIEGYIKSDVEYWLSNVSNETQYYVSKDGEVKKTKVTHQYVIKPIITLSNEVNYSDGNGSIETPYIISERKLEVLNQKFVNEYVSFNNQIWKIIDQDDVGTKIVLDGVLESKRIFDKKYNKFSTSKLFNYLNGDYYKSISDKGKEKMVKGKWYTGLFVSEDGYDYNSIYKDSVEAYVGLLNINDIGLLEYENVFTLTPSDSKKDVIYTVGSDKTVYLDSASKNKSIRPVIYLNPNITVIGGNGSKEEPYVVE